MDDDPVRVVGRERRGQRPAVLVRQPPYEVVLDHEGPGIAGDPQDLRAAFGGQYGAGRVLEERLADEDPGAGGPERVGEQRGAHPVRVDGDGDRPQPGRAGDGQHAGVGR